MKRVIILAVVLFVCTVSGCNTVNIEGLSERLNALYENADVYEILVDASEKENNYFTETDGYPIHNPNRYKLQYNVYEEDGIFSYLNYYGRSVELHFHDGLALIIEPMYVRTTGEVLSLEGIGTELWKYIDVGGTVVFSLDVLKAFSFSDRFAAVVARNRADEYKFGFINMAGEFVIPAVFDFALPFIEGVAQVMLINELEDGEDYEYDEDGDLVFVVQWFLIDKQGEIVKITQKPDLSILSDEYDGTLSAKNQLKIFKRK